MGSGWPPTRCETDRILSKLTNRVDQFRKGSNFRKIKCHLHSTLNELLVLILFYVKSLFKGVLAIRRVFSLVDMITNTKFSNCPNVFKIGVVRQ